MQVDVLLWLTIAPLAVFQLTAASLSQDRSSSINHDAACLVHGPSALQKLWCICNSQSLITAAAYSLAGLSETADKCIQNTDRDDVFVSVLPWIMSKNATASCS